MTVDGTQTIRCPSCSVQLIIPGHAIGKTIRCPQCSYSFVMPDPDSMLDLEVADWLGSNNPDESDVFDQPARGGVNLEEFVDEIRAEAEEEGEDDPIKLTDLVPIGDEDLPYLRGAEERAFSGKRPDAEADGTIGSGTGGELGLNDVRKFAAGIVEDEPLITRSSRGWFQKDRRDIDPDALKMVEEAEKTLAQIEAEEKAKKSKAETKSDAASPPASPAEDAGDDDIEALVDDAVAEEADKQAEKDKAAADTADAAAPSSSGQEAIERARDIAKAKAAQSAAPAPAAEPAITKPAQKSPAPSAAPPAQARGDQPYLRVMDVGVFGVRFAFDSKWLYHEGFRASMPMVCIHTLQNDLTKLIVKPLAWVDKATGHFANANELEAHYQLPLHGARTTREALKLLRPIEEFSMPFNNPMAYYAAVEANSRTPVYCEAVSSATGIQCEVVIPNHQYALRWLAQVSGVWSEAYSDLEQRVLGFEQKVWRALPEQVRQRLMVWFEMNGEEMFVEFFPDAEFSKADEGMAGIVVTDQRMVYTRHRTRGEIDLNDTVKLAIEQQGPFTRVYHVDADGRHRMVDLRKEHWTLLCEILPNLCTKLTLP